MKSSHVVLMTSKSKIYGKEAKVIASFEHKLDSEVCERALNDMLSSTWYGGDRDCVYCACPVSRMTNWSASNSVTIVE